MSKTYFQAKITLNGAYATDAENKIWICDVVFSDNDGAFQGIDVAIGDVISLDTSAVEAGSFTFYNVKSIPVSDYVNLTLELEYSTVNDNTNGPPDLGWLVGQDGMVSRPSANMGLLPVVATEFQGINDKFTEYVQNYNFVKIVDNIGEPTFPKTNGDPFILSRGMVVYIDDTNDTLAHAADAAAYSSSRGAGMVTSAATLAASVCSIQSHGLFEHTTIAWDALTGSTGGLKAGRDYFLRAGAVGGISLVPPTANGACIVKIGKAISTTVLDIDIEPPIQL